MNKRDVNLLINYIIHNGDKNKFECDTYFKGDENVKSIVFYVSIADMENPIFSKILNYLVAKNNVPKLMISLSESARENITLFSYLIQKHKEYRRWGITIDERNYDYIDINQSLVWLSEQDALSELNLNTHILTFSPSLASNQLLKSPHLERFYMGREFKDISAFFENYTVQSYFDESNLFVRDKRILKIMDRNQKLRQIARKCSLSLMMIRKFRRSLFSPLDKNVVKIIAMFLYEQRYEPIHLKTLSVSTSWEMKFQEKKSLEEVETLL